MIRLAHRAGRPIEGAAVTVDKSTNRLTHRNSDNSPLSATDLAWPVLVRDAQWQVRHGVMNKLLPEFSEHV